MDGYLPAAGGEMKVPPGHYAMIVYNYNTECVCIEGDECYGTIRHIRNGVLEWMPERI